ncbi:hypothetical protein GCM10010149_27560 [Nonomuraea roseoviolacea subsp. roseoviolacea]
MLAGLVDELAGLTRLVHQLAGRLTGRLPEVASLHDGLGHALACLDERLSGS